jgi:hypothetical protein
MRKLLAAVAALAATAGGVATAATAGHRTTGVVYAGVTHTEGQNVYVSGDFRDSRLGRGAIVYITRVSGSSQPGTFHVTANTITIYTTHGSLRGSGSADQTVTASSSTVQNGHFSLTRGTGAYRGHTFKGTFSGTSANGVYTFHYRGVYR